MWLIAVFGGFLLESFGSQIEKMLIFDQKILEVANTILSKLQPW